MRTVAQLITDSNATVADLVICLVQVDMFRLAACSTNCASALAPEQLVLLSDTQPPVIRSKQTQNDRSGSDMSDHQNPARLPTEKPRYYAAITSQLLSEQSNVVDHVIQFAIDTLGARRIELRVYDADDHNTSKGYRNGLGCVVLPEAVLHRTDLAGAALPRSAWCVADRSADECSGLDDRCDTARVPAVWCDSDDADRSGDRKSR